MSAGSVWYPDISNLWRIPFFVVILLEVCQFYWSFQRASFSALWFFFYCFSFLFFSVSLISFFIISFCLPWVYLSAFFLVSWGGSLLIWVFFLMLKFPICFKNNKSYTIPLTVVKTTKSPQDRAMYLLSRWLPLNPMSRLFQISAPLSNNSRNDEKQNIGASDLDPIRCDLSDA